MKKRKNKLIKFIIFLVLIVGVFYFLNMKFNIYSKIKNYFNIVEENNDKEEPIIIPKLKIIDEDSNGRIIAVMINNHKQARPHSGLQDAFLNYEIIVEGGITRILSLFRDKTTDRIGSIRSARHYFLDYALENDAVYVHFGWSPQAQKDISSFKIDNLNALSNSSLYWRDKSLKKPTEHTAFTSIERINNLISKKSYRNTSDKDMLLNYSTDEIDLSKNISSIRADKIYIEYSSYTNTSYNYDKASGLYKRFMSGASHSDYITKEQYTTKNIITYQIKNKSIDSAGRQTLENIGSGNGYYITGGYAIPITWEKTDRSSQTIYKYFSGKEIDVNDGVTWIQIQPVGKTLKIEGIEENSSTN